MAAQTPKVLVTPNHVGAINDMLNAALVAGTGKRAALVRHPAAGKTGTSQDFRDAWFVGYTAHFVAGVWVGNDDARPMQRVMGGNLPARLWREVMLLAHDGAVPRPLPGTVLTASAALAQGTPAPFAGDNAQADPIARALAADARAVRDTQSAPAQRASWVDRIRRGLGLGAHSGG
jgi:membrane peptidoglycan carboxypeptidase